MAGSYFDELVEKEEQCEQLPEEEEREEKDDFTDGMCYYITSVDEGYVAEFSGWLYVDGASVGI